ncbi:DNA-binding transcriptional regulator, GntR family [Cohaesibacter marisflavi]|uniref:DNA-binding transcriptional regulator, GntR family n=1 Tax=Cohaesibacter marisflavi TaxID=655353 RepID=A0A1I5CGB5_9HYPH|nr:GntR family transcriptional regulator [Cohaesibacter marisflavi]SFN85862.1 DNA-binding transcriptional regulator, GntR family [Cohaesibacter marisflavi]
MTETKEKKSTKGPYKRGAGVGHVYQTLHREIIELKIAPGSPIDELQLAARFSMSRTPIREALVRLAAEGLITTLPNRATIVSNIDFLNLSQFFDALTLMYRVTTRQAAANYEEGDLADINHWKDLYAKAVETRDVFEMIATNREFHLAIAKAGRNRYYVELFTRLLDEGRRILRLYYQSYNDDIPHLYVDEHEKMIKAIMGRDLALADKLAAEHADQIVRQIQSYIAADTRVNGSLAL